MPGKLPVPSAIPPWCPARPRPAPPPSPARRSLPALCPPAARSLSRRPRPGQAPSAARPPALISGLACPGSALQTRFDRRRRLLRHARFPRRFGLPLRRPPTLRRCNDPHAPPRGSGGASSWRPAHVPASPRPPRHSARAPSASSARRGSRCAWALPRQERASSRAERDRPFEAPRHGDQHPGAAPVRVRGDPGFVRRSEALSGASMRSRRVAEIPCSRIRSGAWSAGSWPATLVAGRPVVRDGNAVLRASRGKSREGRLTATHLASDGSQAQASHMPTCGQSLLLHGEGLPALWGTSGLQTEPAVKGRSGPQLPRPGVSSPDLHRRIKVAM